MACIKLTAYHAGQLTKEETAGLKFRERNEEKRTWMCEARNEESQHLMLEQTTKKGRQSRVQIKFGRNGRSAG